MLTGRSIQSISEELDRQRKSKFDFIIPTMFMGMTFNGALLNKKSGKELPLTDYAHGQIAEHMKIPRAYYKRMQLESPELLARNVNTWMEKQPKGTKRLVRVLDGKGRAYLSDRYLPIDNWDTLNALLPSLQDAGCEIVSAEVTENRMYIKAITPRITGEIKVGDKVQGGLIISNSEIGAGRVEVSPLLYRLVCSNGMIVPDMSLKRHHVGRRVAEEDLTVNGIYSRETIAADIATFLLKARDTVRAVLDQTVFDDVIKRTRRAAGEVIEDAEECIEDVTNRYGLSDEERTALFNNFLGGADNSRWGLVNAVTLTAHHDVTDYDRSVELEKIGGEILYR